MDTGLQNQERVPENLKKHLAISVRNIQWSYAIFWSISARQPGVLEWGDGYYNGDIKTRRTVQAAEINVDPLGLQRSEQLRELYESLSAGEAHPQARRPSAALSPEDLTDAEWYYLVCMSFVFNIGQGLPGRTLANGQPTWLCNAHYADSKMFSRSLLAKSASIQTVVCFPFLRGVVELGVTELVLEDLSLIQQIKTSFLENPYTRVSNKSNIPSAGNTTNNRELEMAALDHEVLDTKFIPAAGFEELRMASPNNSSNGYEPNQPTEEIYMVEGINEGAAATDQLSWQFMDDEFSNCVHNSTDSSDCISQTSVEAERAASVPKGEKENDHGLQELQEFNHLKLTAVDLHNDDLHYQSVLSSLLKSSHQLILGSHFQNCVQKSSFMGWKKRGMVNFQATKSGRNPQEVLKKILFEVPRMHDGGLLECPKENVNNDGVWRPEADHEVNFNHVLSERSRREKLHERFLVLKSMIPSVSKVDKVSILDDTIEYLKELERKVEELESCGKDLTESGERPRRKLQDTVERTSDNYGNLKTNNNGKKPLINKRKACDIDNTQAEINYVVASKDCSTDNVSISMNNKDVVIEIRCPWREGALLDIMDAVSNLHLDSHSVQSSTNDGVLFLTIKSKFKGPSVPLAGMIKQTLQRVARKC